MRDRFLPRKIGLVLVFGVLASYRAMSFSGGAAEPMVIEPVTRPAGINKHKRSDTSVAAAAETLSKKIVLPVRANLDQTGASDLFASNSWTPPPPPPPKPLPPPPPPPPTAPPIPYNFVGLLQDRAKPTAFLAKGDNLLVVTAGDTFDGTYRIESVSASEIVLTYLPLNQRQSILIPGGL